MATEEDNLISEGCANVFQPASVFYNPVQEFNRDLTVTVISEFTKEHFDYINAKDKKAAAKNNENLSDDVEQDHIYDIDHMQAGEYYPKGIKILEALAASGLRSIRFAKEIPGVQKIITNDFDKTAVQYIDRNVEHNNVGHLVSSSCSDAAMLMYQNKRVSDQFDVIDLDPYGSPSPFLDAAVQSVRDGGLLCITCTDMAVLCGNMEGSCYAKYGSMCFRSKFCHEMALRIVLQSIDSHANRYGRYIKPLLCLSADFYVRVFVQVFCSGHVVVESVSKLSMIYHCGGCGAFALQPMAVKTPTKGKYFKSSPSHGPTVSERCEHCNSRHHIGGPVWSAPMYDVPFIERIIKRVDDSKFKVTTSSRIVGVLTVITEELQNVPFYYIMDDLFGIVHLSGPKLSIFRSALINAGYKVSLSHAAKNSVKTDAPMSVIWDIIRCWEKKNPVKSRHMKEGTIVKRILSKEPQIEANFTLRQEAVPSSQTKGLLRWQPNPKRNWGPKPRAKERQVDSLDERRIKGLQKKIAKEEKKRKIDFKQFSCKRFKNGNCDLGEECKYSHIVDEEKKT